jgi:hypothetical protein
LQEFAISVLLAALSPLDNIRSYAVALLCISKPHTL